MPSLWKYAKAFAGVLGEVIEVSFNRCSNETKQYAARCLMFGNHIVSLVTGDEESISELVKNLKKIIAFTLASEPDLRTRNLKVTSAADIVTHMNAQLTKLLFSEMDVNSIVLKYHWFSSFSISNDAFRDYKYETLLFPTPVKIVSLTQINDDFFDWRYHFELEATSTVSNERYNLHVVLNESNVFDCFFDPKVPKELFGHDQLSPLVRYCESRLQNNECPVESIISMFTSQAFKGQHEETAENRAIIKINGDSISGSEDFCHVLAEMTSAGNDDWGISKLPLPITYGRYHNPLAKAFQREFQKQGSKFTYLYNCNSTDFQNNMNSIARDYIEVQIQPTDDDI